MIGAAFQRAADPRVERVVAGFEGQHQDRRRAVAGPGIVRLLRVEYSAIRRIEPGLGDRSYGAGSGEEIGELHRAAGAKARPVLQPHPGLGDHPENAFRADEQAVGAWAGAGARQSGGSR